MADAAQFANDFTNNDGSLLESGLWEHRHGMTLLIQSMQIMWLKYHRNFDMFFVTLKQDLQILFDCCVHMYDSKECYAGLDAFKIIISFPT